MYKKKVTYLARCRNHQSFFRHDICLQTKTTHTDISSPHTDILGSKIFVCVKYFTPNQLSSPISRTKRPLTTYLHLRRAANINLSKGNGPDEEYHLLLP